MRQGEELEKQENMHKCGMGKIVGGNDHAHKRGLNNTKKWEL
jgi:hypothetical protein